MKQPDWYYDDLRQVGLDFDDEGQVQTYDDRQSSTVEEDGELLDTLGLSTDHVFADFGCGTGMLVCEAARRCAKAHALDVSAAMLSAARNRADGIGLSNIEFRHAGFLSADLPENSLDLITSKFALHHLPDLWKGVALSRLHGFLKPGGRLFLRDVVFSCAPGEFADTAEGWCDWMAANTGYVREDVACHIREEHSTYSWILEGLIRAAGFSLERATYSRSAYGDILAVKERELDAD